MKKGKKYLRIILCGVILLLLFGSFFVNSESSLEDQYWGTLSDTYTYNYEVEYYEYAKENPLTTRTEEITIWDVESEANTISFRTNLWETFLGMVHCESEEEYDDYREAWEYDNTTESFRVTYKYDNETQQLGFVDPMLPESVFLDNIPADVPLDPVDLAWHLFGWWNGLGFTFLPVFHSDFSFETNFTIYELAYPDFELNFLETFKFQGKNFQGYTYEFSYTVEYELYPGVENKQELDAKFSYNIEGILYNFYYHDKLLEKRTADYELITEGFLDYSIDSYDETLVVTHSWIYGLSGIIISAIIVFRKRRILR